MTPLLNPRSIALVGASARAGSVGDWTRRSLLGGRYTGKVLLINPRYDSLDGEVCYPSLSALEEAPDLAILNAASQRIEALFDEAMASGVKAISIFDPCRMAEDTAPPLLERMKRKAAQTGVPVCGGNGMGFYNLDTGLFASFYDDSSLLPGSITLIAHSGSVFTVLAHNDRRYRYNLVISAGQEIGATTDEYIDYALGLESTRVIALFIETVRNPAGFKLALEKARRQGIPVVICKVGRSEKSAQHAFTHSGAIAGDHAAFDAICEHFGALSVSSVDDLMATALLLSQGRNVGPGGLTSLGDSGGLREHWSDLASELGVALTELTAPTKTTLRAVLPFELEVDNPLDAAGPMGPGFFKVFEDCLPLLLDDPGTAVASLELDLSDYGTVYGDSFTEFLKKAGGQTDKPFFILNSFAGAQNTKFAQSMLAANVPVINGAETALRAVRHAFAYRDYRAPSWSPSLEADTASSDPDKLACWREKLHKSGVVGEALSEAESLALLRDFGIPVVDAIVVHDEQAAIDVAQTLGFPIAMKTATPGIAHKSDSGGVCLGIDNQQALAHSYRAMAQRLGPAVTIQPMTETGTEVSFGLVADRRFGPVVLVGAGGTMIELLADRVCALAPFDTTTAAALIDRLRIRRLLAGLRGQAPADIIALAQALSRFSIMVSVLSDVLSEIDVNPLVATASGCVAVDALVIASARTSQ